MAARRWLQICFVGNRGALVTMAVAWQTVILHRVFVNTVTKHTFLLWWPRSDPPEVSPQFRAASVPGRGVVVAAPIQWTTTCA